MKGHTCFPLPSLDSFPLYLSACAFLICLLSQSSSYKVLPCIPISHSNRLPVLQDKNTYPHCADEETEAQGGYMIHPRSQEAGPGTLTHMWAPLPTSNSLWGRRVIWTWRGFPLTFLDPLHVLRSLWEGDEPGPPGVGVTPPGQHSQQPRGSEICGHCPRPMVTDLTTVSSLLSQPHS